MRKVKKLDKWVSHKLAANLKNLQFEVSSSLILCNNSEPFLNQMVMCEEKWILWQLVMTSSVDGPRRSSKALPTANLASKRGTGHCLVVCCQSDVLWLSESLQNHYSWDVCWTNRWDALKTAMSAANIGQQKRAQFFSMTTLMTSDCKLHNQCFKSWTNWAVEFCLIHYIHLTSHQPTTTSSSILTAFCRENASTTSRRQKMLSKSSWNSEARIFMLQE